MYLINEEGILDTKDSNAKFLNGEPDAIQSIHIVKSPEAWEHCVCFMERCGKSDGLVFTKVNYH